MSSISNFFKNLFSNRQHQNTVLSVASVTENPVAVSPSDNYLSQWEQERLKRIQVAEKTLKDWVIASVKEKGNLPFTWESGNDEAFITFSDKSEIEERRFEDLEMYIIDRLDIPDAGEFEMTGSGNIYIKNDLVKVKYSSVMKGVIDYDDETEQEIYSEEEKAAGDEVLFTV